MIDLPQTHPQLYEKYLAGNYSVKRSDKRWSGIPCDLAMEQTYIRDGNSPSGITRGRGMTEAVRKLWTLSLSECATMHRALLDLTNTKVFKEEHVELRNSRMREDFEDKKSFYDWLSPRNPFQVSSENLHSLASGLVSVSEIDDTNCDQAEDIGAEIQKSFDNLPYSKCCLKQSSTKNNISTLFTSKNNIEKNPQDEHNSMFNRLILLADRKELLESVFSSHTSLPQSQDLCSEED